MLGCVGSREKALPASTVEPFAVRGVSRSSSGVTFEFGLQGVGNHKVCTEQAIFLVEALQTSAFQSSWTPLPETSWHRLPSEAAAATPRTSPGKKGEQVLCLAKVLGLQAERDYTLRLAARGSPKEQVAHSASFVVRTSDRPKPDGAVLFCCHRWADSLEVEWSLADPDGAPVQECLAQCRLDGLMAGWMSEAPMSFTEVSRGGHRRWRGRLSGLAGATAYRVRARARNSVGWSAGFSPELVCATSDLPSLPKGLSCVRRQPHSVTLRFCVEDPEGAPVQDCSVQVHGVMGYAPHLQSRFLRMPPAQTTLDGSPGKEVRAAVCVLDGLQPETEYFVRLFAQNSSGPSRQPSLPLQVFTSERPRPPAQFKVRVGPRTIEAEWELPDPVGAPVVDCEVEYCKDTLFSTWKPAFARPAAILDAEGALKTDDPTAVAAAVVVSAATALAPTVRKWSTRIDGLERETAYMIRVRPQSFIGSASSWSHSERAATSDRPCAPQGLRCVSRLPSAVWLEFEVPEVLGTAPVSQIHIERSGSFAWQDLQEVEVTRVAGAEATGCSQWSVLVTLGADPATTHRLRAWASNDFGRCSEPSSVCLCRTSDKPWALQAVTCVERLPHALVLGWSATDPEGAPVWRFEVQVKRDQALAAWQPALCVDTTRCEVSPSAIRGHEWRCVVEQLEPASGYRLSVRSCNEVGWSDWYTTEVALETSCLPPPVKAATLKTVTDEQEKEEQTLVDVFMQDPEGAPVVACMVRCPTHAIWTLCKRDDDHNSLGRWRARIPADNFQEGEAATVTVRAANAVGWSKSECKATEEAAAVPGAADGHKERTAVDLVFREVQRALTAGCQAQARLAWVSSEAVARGDHDHAALLARHRVSTKNCHEVLEEVQQQLGQALSSPGEDQGAVLVSQFNQALQRRKLLPNPSAAAKILSLLLRGWMWLETSWRAEFNTLSTGIERAMETAMAAGGKILLHWATQHHAWSRSFDEKVSETLPEGLACAVQLLTTLASGRRLELFESVRQELSACLTLVAAAERQLKRLRMSHRVLTAAEAASCHDFQQKGILQKIESTALGIVTMLVLPLPGAIEVGTLGLGMLWLEGDNANSHLALQHPTGAPLAPILQRLGSCPPPRAAVILAGWASGGHRGVVLVHNATARRITVTATPDKGPSLASKAFAKLSDAHPMVKLVGYAMTESDGGDHVATILPTDVVLIQVPDDTTGLHARLEFSYGPAMHAEKTVGWAAVRPGSAVSFLRLDSSLQVSNSEGENASVDEGTIRLVNNDLAPVTVSFFRAPEKQNHFESALVTEVLEAGEEKRTPLPQPCAGRLFQLEVRHANKQKVICEVRTGQCVTIEGCA